MSAVWNHFEKVPGKLTSARCIRCKKVYSYRTTTTNLKKHLKAKHNVSVYSVYLTSNARRKADSYVNTDSDNTSDGPEVPEGQVEEGSRSPQRELVDQTSGSHTNTSRQRAAIWDYYKKIPGTSNARCVLCNKEYSYKTTTSNLRKHLRFKHQRAFWHLLHKSGESDEKTEGQEILPVGPTTEEPSSSRVEDDLPSPESRSTTQYQHIKTIWDHYKKIPGTPRAQCIVCKKEFYYKSTKAYLKKHLMHKHRRAYNDLLRQQGENEENVNDEESNSNDAYEDLLSLGEQSTEVLGSQQLEQVLRSAGLCTDTQSDYPSTTPVQIKKIKLEKDTTDTDKIREIEYSSDTQAQNTQMSLHNTSTNLQTLQCLKAQKRKHQQNDIFLVIPNTVDKQDKNQIDKKLVDMIAQDYQPFSIVEDQGFRNFVQALNTNYELPNRKLISKTLIPEKYLECRNHVKELVQEAENVCITIDSWTSIAMDSYFSVTAHFKKDCKLLTVMLHCEQISRSHPAESMATSLKNMAQEYNIEDKLALVVSKQSRDIRNAVEINEWVWFGCFLHKLSLTVENAFENIDFILEQVKKVVYHFKKSHHDTEALLKYQTDIENRLQPLRLIHSSPKRWNSVFYMLQRFLKLRRAVEEVTQSIGDLPALSTDVWEAIKHVCMILQPFEEASRVMCDTQYLTASLAIVIVDGLKNVINVMKDKTIPLVAKMFLQALEDGLETHFPKHEMEDNMLLGVCTFLDPRFKIHAFLDHSSVTDTRDETCERTKRANLIKEHVIELVKYKMQGKQKTIPNIPSTVEESKPMSDINKFGKSTADTTSHEASKMYKKLETFLHLQKNTDPLSSSSVEESELISIWGKFDRNIAAVSSFDDLSAKAKSEVDMFLHEEVARRDACPITWWKTHTVLYPHLAELFAEHSHIVVTSVQCKKAFSKREAMLDERRNCLSRKRTPELVFLHNNSALFQ